MFFLVCNQLLARQPCLTSLTMSKLYGSIVRNALLTTAAAAMLLLTVGAHLPNNVRFKKMTALTQAPGNFFLRIIPSLKCTVLLYILSSYL